MPVSYIKKTPNPTPPFYFANEKMLLQHLAAPGLTRAQCVTWHTDAKRSFYPPSLPSQNSGNWWT